MLFSISLLLTRYGVGFLVEEPNLFSLVVTVAPGAIVLAVSLRLLQPQIFSEAMQMIVTALGIASRQPRDQEVSR